MDNPILDTVGDVASASEEFLRFVNSVSSPKVIKKSTKALLKSAEDQIEFISRYPDYDIQFINGVSNIRERTKEELLESAQTRELAKLIRKEKNFEDIIQIASENIKTIPNSSSKIDEDWWNRFEDYAENVSDDDLKFIWGKILAGEFENPGSVSLRTLNLLSSIAKQEALLFCEMAPFSFSLGRNLNYTIFIDSMYSKNISHIRTECFTRLKETGLLADISMFTMGVKDYKSVFFYGDRFKIVIQYKKSDSKLKIEPLIFSVPYTELTSSGKEVFGLIDVDYDINKVIPILQNIKSKDDSVDQIRVLEYDEKESIYKKIFKI